MTKAKKEPRKDFDVVAQTLMIPVALLDENKGQIEGVPKNPRVIKGKRFKQLCESIKEDPELLNLRPLLVYPLGDRYVVIDGNMRVKALRDMAHVTAPCEVL
jgi:ParB-like chromosome segregation protein Spo0J